MNIKTWKVALLLFGSGTCALVYQMTWLREFRLIFGASTGASAAVLAIFMGGLGRAYSMSIVGLPQPAALWLAYLVPELVLPWILVASHWATHRGRITAY